LLLEIWYKELNTRLDAYRKETTIKATTPNRVGITISNTHF